MISRIICLLIGYCFGMILTAEIVTRRLTGKPCSELGTTGNPGMANVMANLGFKAGIEVLAGDLGKTILACLTSWIISGSSIGTLAVLYGGTGAVIGHNFPAWMRFRGGKGVAATCAAIFAVDPLPGLLSMVAGMLVVFATKYLCVGAVVIPAVFTIFLFMFHGTEAGFVGLFLTGMMFERHFPALRTVPSGTCEKTDVLGAIRKKFGKSTD